MIATVAVCGAAAPPFDYWVPDGLAAGPGTVVRVPLGTRTAIGVVLALAGTATVSPERLRGIEEVVDLPPLPADVQEVVRFVAGYYHEPLGEAFALALPPLARAQGAARLRKPAARGAVVLNAEQREAAAAIAGDAGRFAVTLLEGVTGSGKTAVYLESATQAIAQGGQVLMLAPEINLTPQFEDEVRAALPGARVVTLHSGLAAGRRNAHWRAAEAGEADVVLGTRLAVFAPLPRLALVVVDEEHDPSYKQQDGVRYHARDVAVWRAHARGVPVVLGSATPSLETLANARAGRYRHALLRERAREGAKPPVLRRAPVADADAHDGIGGELWKALARTVEAREQSLVFVNRRGYAPALACSACGWQAACRDCSARLVVHRAPAVLRCHHCGYAEIPPRACPSCGNVDLLPLGHGTQRLEAALAAAFPAARIVRVDRDSMRRRGAFASVRERIAADEVDILVGTQMLAKGHDFPRLTLVGVLGADNALYSGDFRATERLAALLAQVAGRAGRASLPGEVIVQTDFPAHPVFASLEDGYPAFADALLAERQALQLPPFTHFALLGAEAPARDDAMAFLEAAHAAALAILDEGDGTPRRAGRGAEPPAITLRPPMAAAMARRAGHERAQMLVESADRRALQAFLARFRAAIDALPARRVRYALDVDPATI